jgi:ribulose 1,5-bisphosphate carboxylase large subunit-like protein
LRSKDKDTHPASPNAGAHAFHQAIDAVMQGIEVIDYAEEHEEPKTALTKWGAGKTSFQM